MYSSHSRSWNTVLKKQCREISKILSFFTKQLLMVTKQTAEAVSLVPNHIAIWLIYCESIWFKSHKEKSHMKSYNVMTWSIFERTSAEDLIESAAIEIKPCCRQLCCLSFLSANIWTILKLYSTYILHFLVLHFQGFQSVYNKAVGSLFM